MTLAPRLQVLGRGASNSRRSGGSAAVLQCCSAAVFQKRLDSLDSLDSLESLPGAPKKAI